MSDLITAAKLSELCDAAVDAMVLLDTMATSTVQGLPEAAKCIEVAGRIHAAIYAFENK